MAKLKMRKLVKELETTTLVLEKQQNRINNLLAMLAVVAHNNNGVIEFTKDEIDSLPDAGLSISGDKGAFKISLEYFDVEDQEHSGEEQNSQQSA